MHPTQRTGHRRPTIQLGAEALEGRELLTGGAGNTIAIFRGAIADANGSAEVSYTINPSNFTIPRRKILLGVDVAAASSSTIQPLISSIKQSSGDLAAGTFHSIYNPHLSHSQVAAGAGTSAVLSPASLLPNSNSPVKYSVNVSAENKTSGNYLVGFYLPGDANGDGKVDQTDITAIKAARGSVSGDSTYSFDADANRDGRIGNIDLKAAKRNLGAATTISPTVTSSLDASTDSGESDRVTNQQTVHFTGVATPGASIVYSEVNHKAPDATTTADASGNYSLNVTLGLGANTFQVTSTDSFGQTISGQIQPVTYTNVTVSTKKTT